MALHLIADDPTPDEPTVPEPSVCPVCHGDRIQPIVVCASLAAELGDKLPLLRSSFPCLSCCCLRCGAYLGGQLGGLCNDCADDLGDRAYERRQDA